MSAPRKCLTNCASEPSARRGPQVARSRLPPGTWASTRRLCGTGVRRARADQGGRPDLLTTAGMGELAQLCKESTELRQSMKSSMLRRVLRQGSRRTTPAASDRSPLDAGRTSNRPSGFAPSCGRDTHGARWIHRRLWREGATWTVERGKPKTASAWTDMCGRRRRSGSVPEARCRRWHQRRSPASGR